MGGPGALWSAPSPAGHPQARLWTAPRGPAGRPGQALRPSSPTHTLPLCRPPGPSQGSTRPLEKHQRKQPHRQGRADPACSHHPLPLQGTRSREAGELRAPGCLRGRCGRDRSLNAETQPHASQEWGAGGWGGRQDEPPAQHRVEEHGLPLLYLSGITGSPGSGPGTPSRGRGERVPCTLQVRDGTGHRPTSKHTVGGGFGGTRAGEWGRAVPLCGWQPGRELLGQAGLTWSRGVWAQPHGRAGCLGGGVAAAPRAPQGPPGHSPGEAPANLRAVLPERLPAAWACPLTAALRACVVAGTGTAIVGLPGQRGPPCRPPGFRLRGSRPLSEAGQAFTVSVTRSLSHSRAGDRC